MIFEKHDVDDIGGKSRKKHKDFLNGMYDEVNDSGRGEKGI